MNIILIFLLTVIAESWGQEKFQEKIPVFGVIKPGSISTLISVNHGMLNKAPAPLGSSVQAGDVVVEVLEKETIRAYRSTISGKVAKVHVTSGAALSPGMPLVTIIDDRKKEVEISLSPQEAGKVKVGTIVEDRKSGESFGKISRLSPLVDPESGAIVAFASTSRALNNYIGDVVPLTLVVREVTDCKVVSLGQAQSHQQDFQIEAVHDGQACLKRRPANVK